MKPEEITRLYDEYLAQQKRALEEAYARAKEQVQSELYPLWYQIHRGLHEAYENGTMKMDLRKLVRAYTNGDRWKFWWDRRELNRPMPIPVTVPVVEAPRVAPEPPKINVQFPENPYDGQLFTYHFEGKAVEFEWFEEPALGEPRWEITRASMRGQDAAWISQHLTELMGND